MATPIQLMQGRSALYLTSQFSTYVNQAQQVMLGMENVERQAAEFGWSAEFTAAQLAIQANRLRTAAKNIISGVATAGGVMGNAMEATGGDFDVLMEWQTVGDGNVCPDCEAIGGTVRTFLEWMNSAMPGDGSTVCGGRCRCSLVSQGKATGEVLNVEKG